jgi:hypothetical protein
LAALYEKDALLKKDHMSNCCTEEAEEVIETVSPGSGKRPRMPYPWFPGQAKELCLFIEAWEEYIAKNHAGVPDRTLDQLMRRHCMPINTGRIKDKAGSTLEAWVRLENHFNGQRLQMEDIMVKVLKKKDGR